MIGNYEKLENVNVSDTAPTKLKVCCQCDINVLGMFVAKSLRLAGPEFIIFS